MYYATFWIDTMAVIIGIVLLLGNIVGHHRIDKKANIFLHVLCFEMAATVLDGIWNYNNGNFVNFVLSKTLVALALVFGVIGFVFLGSYLTLLLQERDVRAKRWSWILRLLGFLAVINTAYNCTNGQYIYYYHGHVYHGPSYANFLYTVLALGIYQVVLILAYCKKLGLKDTIVTLSFYVAPCFAIIDRVKGNSVNIIFGSAMVSLLIINNLLHGKEVRNLELREEIAVQSEKNKSRFLANMSHEIRTPINAVLGLNEMILREATERNIINYAQDVKSAGTTLLSLVNDVLDFSKIESGKMELVETDYEISSILNDVVNMTSVKAKDKGLGFELQVDPSIPRIMHGDEVRIKQIITNILNNAVKYTSMGYVKLKISYVKDGDFAIKMTVTVDDTGMGMKEEEMEKLFQPFARLNETENRSIEGTGLGMAITKYFLSLMDSELEVRSTYGVGSTFGFTIRQEVVNWECMGNYQDAFKRLKENKAEYKAKLEAPNARVLVVDDMPMNLAVVRGLLKGTLVNIETATSGAETLEICAYNKYDLIYLDHMMPGMDGVETLKKLREDENGLNFKTPVIALTANAVSGAREEYLSVGFSDYLTKPIDPERLEKTLISFLPEGLVNVTDEDALEFNPNEGKKAAGNPILEKIKSIPLIEYEDGIQAAGGEEIYLIAAKEFTLTVDNTAELIEKYWKAGDFRNYTIQVHGLKSSARIVGDNQLSELARSLEFAGNDENIELINEKTQILLDRFMELRGYLENALEEETTTEKPAIESEQLKEAVDMIKQGLEDFDFDTISAVVDQLEKYKLPDDFTGIFKKMRGYVADVNYDGMVELVKNINL